MTAPRTAARLLVIVVFLLPIAFMVSGSLRRLGAPPPEGFELVPRDAGLGGYRGAADAVPLGRLLANSVAVVAVAVPMTVIVASWAGFALAQLPRRSRRLLVGAIVALLMVPLPMLWVARFVIYLRLGVLDTFVPLMAPALVATTPFTVLLAYRSFSRIPPEIWDAARLEGASALRTWWRVGLPMVTATTTAIAAVAFVFHWGNYLDALLYVQTPDRRTLPLGIGELAQLDPTELPVMLAGAVLLAVPALLVLLAVQRPLLQDSDGTKVSA
ncbi:MAG TPA: carbohydrate ABC transporter permease [Mycobacteriales bacterium]|nr:carbohydrate ABC transporter permease [Mycobacteriales bacterium]